MATDHRHSPDDDEFQERAAILEFDGGYSRSEAERRAQMELIELFEDRSE